MTTTTIRGRNARIREAKQAEADRRALAILSRPRNVATPPSHIGRLQPSTERAIYRRRHRQPGLRGKPAGPATKAPWNRAVKAEQRARVARARAQNRHG